MSEVINNNKRTTDAIALHLHEESIVTVINVHRVKLQADRDGNISAYCEGCPDLDFPIHGKPQTWHEDDPERHAAWLDAFHHLAQSIIEESV